MSAIRTSKARQAAIERMMTVMQAEYDTELAAVQDTGLPLPAPAAKDYFQGFTPPDDAIANTESGVVVYFINQSSRARNSIGSAGPSGHYEKRQMSIAVAVVFKVENYDQSKMVRTDEDGNAVRPLQTDEVQRLRAERYLGAMDEVIRKYAADGSTIHDIELIDDMSTTVSVNEEDYYGTYGIGSATFQVTQQTQAPNFEQLP